MNFFLSHGARGSFSGQGFDPKRVEWFIVNPNPQGLLSEVDSLLRCGRTVLLMESDEPLSDRVLEVRDGNKIVISYPYGSEKQALEIIERPGDIYFDWA